MRRVFSARHVSSLRGLRKIIGGPHIMPTTRISSSPSLTMRLQERLRFVGGGTHDSTELRQAWLHLQKQRSNAQQRAKSRHPRALAQCQISLHQLDVLRLVIYPQLQGHLGNQHQTYYSSQSLRLSAVSLLLGCRRCSRHGAQGRTQHNSKARPGTCIFATHVMPS